MQWIDVNDRLPTDNEWKFARFGFIDEPDDGLETGCSVAAYYANNCWHGVTPLTGLVISYWMDEPPPPKLIGDSK